MQHSISGQHHSQLPNAFHLQYPAYTQYQYQLQYPAPTQRAPQALYTPQLQIQYPVYRQQTQNSGAFNPAPQPQAASYSYQPFQNHTQWQLQQPFIADDAQWYQQYQTTPTAPPVIVQPTPSEYQSPLAPAIIHQSPVKGSSRETAIFIEADDDEPIEMQPSPPVPSSPAPPISAPKKPERSYYSETFAELDSTGRKKLDENGKPIRLSIEKMVRRPGRPRPDLPQPLPARPKSRAAAPTVEKAEQKVLEEAVLVEPKETQSDKERPCSPKRKSAEAECNSEPAPKKRRARTKKAQSPATPPPQTLDFTADPFIVDEEEHKDMFSELVVDETTTHGGSDTEWVPDFKKRSVVRALPNLPARSRARDATIKTVSQTTLPVEPEESEDACRARLARLADELQAEMDEDDDEEKEQKEGERPEMGQGDEEEGEQSNEYIAPRTRSPSIESDEDEDEDYAGNLKYKSR